MGWEHFLKEEPLSIATWEPFISKSISTGLWELGAEQLQWSNVGRNLGLAAQRQPEGTRVWPRPKLGGVCKMEARFIIDAPLLPHTCVWPHHSHLLLSKLTVGRAPPLQLLGTSKQLPKTWRQG